MMNNRYYEALLEGRYQPRIDVSEADGIYTAKFEAPNGVKVEKTSVDQAEAFRQCSYEVMEGIRQGTIHPFI